MDMSITDGLVLMPTPFAEGLDVWSREDGTEGSASYEGQSNAALVAADQDFAGCLELQKQQSVQSLRYMGRTPIVPGLYLRVTARVKAVSGNLPTVRIAAWAGNSAGHVSGLPETGPQVTLTGYGEVVEVSAIVGVGNRRGVDMVWGPEPSYGHFGLDLTGPNGGIVRIDDIAIEDVTGIFARKLMDWVDVRDYGALGDGTTDDSAAFEAADADAAGRTVLVSEGIYFLDSHVTFESPVRFVGTLTMPDDKRLSLTRNYDLPSYEAAMGAEDKGFAKMLQALFYFTDHSVLDLGGRQVNLTAPIDVAAVTGKADGFATRRALANGQLSLDDSAAWDSGTVTSQARYSADQPRQLTEVANVAQIEVGSLVTGNGVGREVYVREVNAGAGTVTLSQPLWNAEGVQSYTFTRFRYALDFSGMAKLSSFEIERMEFRCSGKGSAIMLAPSGTIFRVADCVFTKPKDRAITSIGTGCQGMLLDRNQFISDEQSLRVQDRKSVAININENDTKIRDNRGVKFRHFAVMNGTGHMYQGNHIFQGDGETDGIRMASLVFTQLNTKSVVNGCYIDNSFIEWSNEHDPAPEFSNEYSYGGLSVTGTIFTVNDVAPSFRWLVIAPKGSGHYIQGLTVTDNVFRTLNGNIGRVEMVDDTVAGLDFSRTRNLRFEGNSFNGVDQAAVNPVVLEFQQNSAMKIWVLDPAAYLPFGAFARNVQGFVPEGPVTDAEGKVESSMPYAQPLQGSEGKQVSLSWPVAVKGKVLVTVRADNPN